MDSYDSYLKHEAGNVLPVEEALQIYNEIFQTVSICKCDDLDEFVTSFLHSACAYCAMRDKWEFFSREEKIEKDSLRTIMHNSFIDSVNILSRLLNSEGIVFVKKYFHELPS